MILINLLPWREQQREWRRKQFFIILIISLAITLFIAFLFYFTIKTQLRAELSANQYLTSEISTVDNKIVEIQKLKGQRLELIERMRLIGSLQAERASTIHLFDQMVRIVPEGVYLSEVQRSGETVLLTGKAESNSRVSELMRHIEASKWLADPVLTQIKAEDDETESLTRNFQLEMEILSTPKAVN